VTTTSTSRPSCAEGPVTAERTTAGQLDGRLDGALVRRRLDDIRARIVAAGGDPDAIEVVAVTKGFPPPIVAVAADAGLTTLGENYAPELLAKAAWLAEPPAPTGAVHGPFTNAVHWQFIGRLQRNKVRALAPHVERWQSIDRAALVDEVARRAPGARILLQVNATGEADKGGCEPAGVAALLDRARAAGLVVEGLMTVGPTDAAVSPAPAFAAVRRLVDLNGLSCASMGMTGDLEVAVREGSTMIRIGTALFGPRPGGADVGN
jgi:pyridoxal phosphate enzyme (YggS family)